MNEIKKEDLVYKFIVFKIKGHKTYRFADKKTAEQTKDKYDITDIEVDRLTGKIKVGSLEL